MKNDAISTSALAKLLEIPVQQLFSTFSDYGWIRKTDDGWLLNAKGEFEGGGYVNSARYGRYIVWPKTLCDHPLLQAIESHRLLSSGAVAKKFGLNGRQLNRVFAELGWLKPNPYGWDLTAHGKALGGQLFENQQSSLCYAMWPDDITDHPALLRFLEQLKVVDSAQETDLFTTTEKQFISIDGKLCDSLAAQEIANWLYLAGVRYCIHSALPVAETLITDFYLADSYCYIEYWAEGEHADCLSARMRRAEVVKELGYKLINIHPEDISNLDDFLCRRMQDLGIRFF